MVMVCAPIPVTSELVPTILEAPNDHSSKENKRQNQQYCQKDKEPPVITDDELISLILEAGGRAPSLSPPSWSALLWCSRTTRTRSSTPSTS